MPIQNHDVQLTHILRMNSKVIILVEKNVQHLYLGVGSQRILNDLIIIWGIIYHIKCVSKTTIILTKNHIENQGGNVIQGEHVQPVSHSLTQKTFAVIAIVISMTKCTGMKLHLIVEFQYEFCSRLDSFLALDYDYEKKLKLYILHRIETMLQSSSPCFVDAININSTHFMMIPSFQGVD